jgi:hypothetical protein
MPGKDRLMQRQVKRAGASLLDIGCGSGEPIARYFFEIGHVFVPQQSTFLGGSSN